MKEVQITMFEAVDGQKFDTVEQCVAQDVALLDQLLATLHPDGVRAALKRVGITIRVDRLPTAKTEPAPESAKQAA